VDGLTRAFALADLRPDLMRRDPHAQEPSLSGRRAGSG
jgi:hypothetical protein